MYIKAQREKIFTKKKENHLSVHLSAIVAVWSTEKFCPKQSFPVEIVLADIFNWPTFSSIRLFSLSQLSQTEIVCNRIRVSIYIKRTETRGRNLRSEKYNIVLLASIYSYVSRKNIDKRELAEECCKEFLKR